MELELTSCPECGLPAHVEQRHVLESTDGPIEHAKVRCVSGHWFFLSVAALAETAGRREARAGRPVSRH